ncbi:hypothetical protein DENSPDRAFT_778729 [Dentipellis sp. KUC8613]|nr:hypothetical protein DENSPDRAFT_778729 [Dentipellis sp. KUC8613]
MHAKANTKGVPPQHLLALPSVSSSLSALPQAKSLANVSLHTSSTPVQHAADSEAKLKKALSKNAASMGQSQASPYSSTQTSPGHSSQGLMMRKPVRV